MDQPIRAGGGQSVLGRGLPGLRPQHLQHRQRGDVFLSARCAGQRRRTQQAQGLIVHHQGGVVVPVESGCGMNVAAPGRAAGRRNPSRAWCARGPAIRWQPANRRSSSPSRFSAGTLASVKNTSLKSRWSMVVHVGERPALDAGGVRGDDQDADALVFRALRDWCARRSAATSAVVGPEVHTFCPLTTKSSPSRTAGCAAPARSEPAPGSLIPSGAVMSPRRIGTAHRRFCSASAERQQRCRDDFHALRVEADW